MKTSNEACTRLAWSRNALLCVLLASGPNLMAYASPAPVNLGTAANFSILAKTTITNAGGATVLGNLGLSPAAASFITGFATWQEDPSDQFWTSSNITGRAYAANNSPPTPSILTTAIGDMQNAYTDAAGRAANASGLGGGTLNGNTLAPGVYAWGSALNITGNITLSGSSSDVWIFKVAQTLDLASGAQIILAGGAQVGNVFWQVAGNATLETTSVLNGNILCQTAIIVDSGATLNGKALAQSAVNLGTTSRVASTGEYAGKNPPAAGKTFAYPSPANGGVVNIAYTMEDSGTADIRVYNAVGNLAASVRSGEELAGTQISLIPLGGFAPGIYLYKIVLTYDSGASQSLDVQKFAVGK